MGSHSLTVLGDAVFDAFKDVFSAPEEEEKNKGTEKIFEEIVVENFPNRGKEIVNQVQEEQSPIQDKSKEKHAKTHINQSIKN